MGGILLLLTRNRFFACKEDWFGSFEVSESFLDHVNSNLLAEDFPQTLILLRMWCVIFCVLLFEVSIG